MSFFSKLLGAFRGSPPSADGAGRNAFWIYLRCNACGEPIRVRINREHDLSADFDEESDAPTGYHGHKEVVGERCFRRIQVDLTFDGQRRLTEQHIQGGTFLTEEEYQAALAEEAAGSTPPPAAPAAPSP
jgi:hypothetical protein